MSQRYTIESIESEWPPEAFDEADRVLQGTGAPDIKKMPKGLYVVQFTDAGQTETEIQVAGNEVVRWTCDCSGFGKNRKCIHILAGLILIRREKAALQAKKSKPKGTAAMNIRTALDHVRLDELKLFCRDYARQDNAFSLLLKARFIRNLSSDRFPDKYDTLLGQIIRINRSGKVQLNRSERKTVTFMIDSMLHHFEEAMVDRQYVEAFDIISSVLGRMHMTIDRTSDYADYFKEQITTVYEKFLVFLQAPIAPEMKQAAFRFSLELASRSRYRILDYDFNAISVITPTAVELNVCRPLFDLLSRKVIDAEKDMSEWPTVAALTCYRSESRQEARELFHRVDQPVVTKAFENLFNIGEFQCISWMIRQIDISIFRDKNKSRIYRKAFAAAEHLQDPEIMEQAGMELIILLRDISFFEALINHPDIPAGTVERIAEERIRETLSGDDQDKMLAEFFIASGKQQELLELMVHKADIDFFLRYDIHVLPGLKRELTESYLNLIEDHLNHYAGNVNVDMIQKWRQHFEILNLSGEVEEVLTKLQEAHPERQLLFGNLKKR